MIKSAIVPLRSNLVDGKILNNLIIDDLVSLYHLCLVLPFTVLLTLRSGLSLRPIMAKPVTLLLMVLSFALYGPS